MTVICAYCDKNIGEKCGRCSGEVEALLGPPPTLEGERIFFWCPACDDIFVRGEVFTDGQWRASEPSHGACPACYERILAELRELNALEEEAS